MASQSHPEPEPPPRREAPELPAAEGGAPAFDPLPPGAGPAPVQRWWGRHLSELRWPVEAVRLLSDPVFYGRGVPRGDGRPVVLLPGFLVGDVTLLPMAAWLRRLGYRPYSCRFVVNVDCSERAVERVQRRALELAHRHGRKVALVGHSRGGHFAKVVAVQRPDQGLPCRDGRGRPRPPLRHQRAYRGGGRGRPWRTPPDERAGA